MLESSVKQPPGFGDMSKAEQLRYLQDLWDQIAEHPEELPVPDSHLALAKERLQSYRDQSSEASSAFEVLDRLSLKEK